MFLLLTLSKLRLLGKDKTTSTLLKQSNFSMVWNTPSAIIFSFYATCNCIKNLKKPVKLKSNLSASVLISNLIRAGIFQNQVVSTARCLLSFVIKQSSITSAFQYCSINWDFLMNFFFDASFEIKKKQNVNHFLMVDSENVLAKSLCVN